MDQGSTKVTWRVFASYLDIDQPQFWSMKSDTRWFPPFFSGAKYCYGTIKCSKIPAPWRRWRGIACLGHRHPLILPSLRNASDSFKQCPLWIYTQVLCSLFIAWHTTLLRECIFECYHNCCTFFSLGGLMPLEISFYFPDLVSLSTWKRFQF